MAMESPNFFTKPPGRPHEGHAPSKHPQPEVESLRFMVGTTNGQSDFYPATTVIVDFMMI